MSFFPKLHSAPFNFLKDKLKNVKRVITGLCHYHYHYYYYFYCPTSPLSPFLSQSEWRPLSLPLPPSLPSFSPQSFCLFALT